MACWSCSAIASASAGGSPGRLTSTTSRLVRGAGGAANCQLATVPISARCSSSASETASQRRYGRVTGAYWIGSLTDQDMGSSRSAAVGLEAAFDGVHQHPGDIGAALVIDLAHAGGARHVDLGGVVADQVEAHEHPPRLADHRLQPVPPAARLPRVSPAMGTRARP